jgi:UDP-N-acetylglucosamine:LPS N-acetylglucosamine transferase
VQADNVTPLDRNELLLNYMPHMDFVIARAGFNTISECVASRVPLLLIGEGSNPEMEMNMLFVKQEGLGSFVSLHSFADKLVDTIRAFDETELGAIRRRLQEHDYAINGAAVIAEDILSRLR